MCLSLNLFSNRDWVNNNIQGQHSRVIHFSSVLHVSQKAERQKCEDSEHKELKCLSVENVMSVSQMATSSKPGWSASDPAPC